jgi:hypothetical protein
VTSHFHRKLLGLPAAPPEPVELHRPSDDQLRLSLRTAREALTEGSALRFHAADIAAILEELIERRGKDTKPELME